MLTTALVPEAARVAMAAKSLAQREELETELRGARLRRSLEALLLRTLELRGSTPPLPHSDQPRGHPAWLPEHLSKATTLYVAPLVDALFAAREWQAGAGVGVVWAPLDKLAAAGPRLRRPLSEAPLPVGTEARCASSVMRTRHRHTAGPRSGPAQWCSAAPSQR